MVMLQEKVKTTNNINISSFTSFMVENSVIKSSNNLCSLKYEVQDVLETILMEINLLKRLKTYNSEHVLNMYLNTVIIPIHKYSTYTNILSKEFINELNSYDLDKDTKYINFFFTNQFGVEFNKKRVIELYEEILDFHSTLFNLVK